MTNDGLIWPIPGAALRSRPLDSCVCGGRLTPVKQPDLTNEFPDMWLVTCRVCNRCRREDLTPWP